MAMNTELEKLKPEIDAMCTGCVRLLFIRGSSYSYCPFGTEGQIDRVKKGKCDDRRVLIPDPIKKVGEYWVSRRQSEG